MTTRSVLEHALTVYYDGDAVLAGKVIDQHEHALAERIRAVCHDAYDPGEEGVDQISGMTAANLIDPEVST